jgi:formate-dependent nitrite reductase cytochrome c552 subunit
MDGVMSALPEIAPYHACIACLKGDTETLVYLHGDLDFHAATMTKWGIPEDEVTDMMQVDQPAETQRYTVCVDCAAKAGMQATSSAVVAYCDDMRIRPIELG